MTAALVHHLSHPFSRTPPCAAPTPAAHLSRQKISVAVHFRPTAPASSDDSSTSGGDREWRIDDTRISLLHHAAPVPSASFAYKAAKLRDLQAQHVVHRVFLDPGGKHCVTTVVHLGGAETYYQHARWPRPKPLPCLRGLLVNAVAWNCQSITEALTKEVILGTESGQIFEMAVDEADKREKYVKLFFELTELREGIKDLQMETAVVGNATRFYVMAVTPMRL